MKVPYLSAARPGDVGVVDGAQHLVDEHPDLCNKIKTYDYMYASSQHAPEVRENQSFEIRALFWSEFGIIERKKMFNAWAQTPEFFGLYISGSKSGSVTLRKYNGIL